MQFNRYSSFLLTTLLACASNVAAGDGEKFTVTFTLDGTTTSLVGPTVLSNDGMTVTVSDKALLSSALGLASQVIENISQLEVDILSAKAGVSTMSVSSYSTAKNVSYSIENSVNEANRPANFIFGSVLLGTALSALILL